MTSEEYRAASMDMAYLAACAVNGRVPEATRVHGMNLEHLYKVAELHMLTGITAMALESAGVKDKAFTQSMGKAIRKVATFDVERTAVLAKLEEAGIWHVPLKGSVLKSLYPKIGMRQMADNDILCDPSRMEDVRVIMEGLGFSPRGSIGKSNHDAYQKPPVCNFEMHGALFGLRHDKRLVEYYKNVRTRLLPDEDSSFGFHFSDEDFYVYVLAHEYKHYSNSGTGLRYILDTYVYLRQKSEAMDWSYVSGELEKLGIADFEAQNRSLALHLFGGETLTARDQEMLEYVLFSGTFGTIQNRVKNSVNKYGNGFLGKLRYVFSRLFLPLKIVRVQYPLFLKYPILLPFLPFYRIFRGLTKRRNEMKTELRTLVKYKSKK